MTTQFRIGEGVPRDAVEDVCGELGLRLANVVARTDAHPAQAIYVTADRLTLLHLVDDPAAGRAAVLRGAAAEALTSRMLRALAGSTSPGGERTGESDIHTEKSDAQAGESDIHTEKSDTRTGKSDIHTGKSDSQAGEGEAR